MQTMEASRKSHTIKGDRDDKILQKALVNLEEGECIS